MNAEKNDLATDIVVKLHSTNTYKNTLQSNNCILELMENEEYFIA